MRENESRTEQIKCKQQSKGEKVEERSEENQIKIKNYGSECLWIETTEKEKNSTSFKSFSSFSSAFSMLLCSQHKFNAL